MKNKRFKPNEMHKDENQKVLVNEGAIKEKWK